MQVLTCLSRLHNVFTATSVSSLEESIRVGEVCFYFESGRFTQVLLYMQHPG